MLATAKQDSVSPLSFCPGPHNEVQFMYLHVVQCHVNACTCTVQAVAERCGFWRFVIMHVVFSRNEVDFN